MTSPVPAGQTGKRVLRPKEVSERYGVPVATMYRLMDQGQFPSPIQLGPRAVGWRVEDLEAWLDSRPSARTEPGGGDHDTGGKSMATTRYSETDDFEEGTRREWNEDSSIREEFSSLEAYRAYRRAELEGRSAPKIPEGTAQDELAAHQRIKGKGGAK